MNGIDLKGKAALVTGSSRGIGKAIALSLADAGADVMVHCASRINAAEEVSEMIRKKGVRTLAVSGDLAVDGVCDMLFETAEKAFGKLDILILNASLQIKKKWTDITAQDFDRQTRINYRASMRLMQLAVPKMAERRWGRVITIGSVQEKKPHPDMLVYSSSKSAQTGLIMSLAPIYAPYGITFNNIAPGVIATDRNTEALSDPEYAKKVMNSIPVKFYGQPEDIAPIVTTLCGDCSRYITGQSIFADGGKSL